MNTCHLLLRAMARSTIAIGILIIEESTGFEIVIKVMESRPVGKAFVIKIVRLFAFRTLP